MTQDKFDILGPLMNEIGRELVDIAGGGPKGVFLYVEIGEGWISPGVFKDSGKVVQYFDAAGSVLEDLLLDAWHAEPVGKRWVVMEYDLVDGKFAVTFRYPEEVNVEVFDEERRKAAVRVRFGDKPVVYPPTAAPST